MILVVGSTGEMGRETVRQFLAAGIPIRAMTRTPEKAQDLLRLGAEVVQGDLIDRPSLQKACKGMKGVVSAAHQLMGGGMYTSKAVDDTGHRALIDEARAAGVEHFIYASTLGASPNAPVAFNRTKFAIEQYLTESGMHYTIIRGPAFMEWHAHNLLGKDILENGKATIFGKGENPINFISARDMAKFAVVGITDPRACNQTINAIGPDNVSKNEVAEMYQRISGRPAKISHVPPLMLKIMPAIMRFAKPELVQVIQLSYLMDTEDQVMDPRETLEKYPLRLTRLEEFIHEKVAEYNTGKAG